MRAHIGGWVLLALTVLLQPPGRVAADTKLDLSVDPARFLARATHAYTDEFPLGQVQNQAYGYLFPQGPFFLLTHFAGVPEWVAQRAWWTLLVCLAYSGALLLARRTGVRGRVPQVTAALLYALSPRILTTLTAISSEAWPVALVPWTLIPLARARPRVAGAVLAVAAMGAVNATATIAACVPALIWLLCRHEYARAAWFTLGAAAVSAWWIGPLLVLGRYSPPFTEFIESASVTTAWLNPVEVLRGATSWAPFVDAERTAGFLVVGEPVFVLATALVAGFGLAGLARRNVPWRSTWVVMLAVGFALFCSAHFWVPLLDGPLAPFRNLHKFDPLVRLPLAIGVGHLLARINRPRAVGVVLTAAVAVAPAWSLRLLPDGTWTEISPEWVAAGEWLEEHAAGTRTLVVPSASFARQTWGWTRDEPIQALTSTRFAFRDAVPLADPEAIRGLDGQVRAVDPEALRAIGVGAVVVRHDLATGPPATTAPPVDPAYAARNLGEPTVSFRDEGDDTGVDIYLLEPQRDAMITDAEPVTVDGGGEVLPLLWARWGYFPARLVDRHANVVTDTPALAERNYGTLRGAQSAPLAQGEGGNVGNRLPDYPSAGTRVGVAEDGGQVRASSSAADANAFGGAVAGASLTSAFDGAPETAWWPAPGDRHPWIEVPPVAESLTLTATRTTTVELTGGAQRRVTLVAGEPRTIRAPGTTRIGLTERVGIAEVDAGVSRTVEVPGTADTYFFQRHFPETQVIQRRFTTAVDATWHLDAPATIDGTRYPSGPVHLPAGPHDLFTRRDAVALTRGEAPTPIWSPLPATLAPADHARTIITTRAFNAGLRATVGGHALEPTLIDAATQAFTVPAGASGEFRMYFAGEATYRYSLLLGGAFSALVALACLVAVVRKRGDGSMADPPELPRVDRAAPLLATVAVVAAGPVAGLVAAVSAWAIRRFTVLPSAWLSGGALVVAGLVLARAPWPSASYAGATLLPVVGCFAVACLAWPDRDE
ncbi:DUF3367 domain-containing protein [Corynebacterium hadale]|nr:alpha-(1->3)-arabinofuranosyltransferase family protein [Corynebacterium hadale]MCG7253389.1 DUF3367 domain-containing protein [Corynebacterium hadale]MCG7255609.1 DUF3367 domain-containing protein [Corynebacterium hadale]MCG7264814.1 DUF3367 domain-containing protein [Corynebacterium hadale]